MTYRVLVPSQPVLTEVLYLRLVLAETVKTYSPTVVISAEKACLEGGLVCALISAEKACLGDSLVLYSPPVSLYSRRPCTCDESIKENQDASRC